MFYFLKAQTLQAFFIEQDKKLIIKNLTLKGPGEYPIREDLCVVSAPCGVYKYFFSKIFGIS